MRTLSPEAFRVQVRIANRHPTRPHQDWARSIPDLQFLLIRAGTYRYEDAHGAVTVEPGQILCIEPGIDHVLTHLGTVDGALAGLHCELGPGRWIDGDYRSDPLPPRICTADPQSEADFLACAEAFEGYHRQRRALVDSLATVLVVRLSGGWTGAGSAAGLSGRMQAMLAHLRAHAVAGCDRHDLARAFGLTPEYVNACFRRELDTTPGEVLHRERCRIAYALLHDQGMSVGEAAEAAGYEDPFHFSRIFTRLYGMAPSKVR